MSQPMAEQAPSGARAPDGPAVRFQRRMVARYGAVRCAAIETALTVLFSFVTSLVCYEVLGIPYLEVPVAIVLPVVLPLVGAFPTLLMINRLVVAMLQREAINARQYEALQLMARETSHQRRSAEAASRAKTDMLANLSHELRTPLNAIIGFSEIMHQQSFGPLGNARYAEYAGDIIASGRHLLALVNDLLDLAKIERGARTYQLEQLNPHEVIRQCVQLVRSEAARAGLDLRVASDDGTLEIRCDAVSLRQILLNLLSNAIKFTPQGGRIEIGCRLAAGAPSIFVRDSGIGIPAAQHDRVFEPFAQVDNVMTRAHAGTGLGLALVKAMMEQHGGRVRLESEVGRGTTVTLHFPPLAPLEGAEAAE